MVRKNSDDSDSSVLLPIQDCPGRDRECEVKHANLTLGLNNVAMLMLLVVGVRNVRSFLDHSASCPPDG
jgi:hypothetical protein